MNEKKVIHRKEKIIEIDESVTGIRIKERVYRLPVIDEGSDKQYLIKKTFSGIYMIGAST